MALLSVEELEPHRSAIRRVCFRMLRDASTVTVKHTARSGGSGRVALSMNCSEFLADTRPLKLNPKAPRAAIAADPDPGRRAVQIRPRVYVGGVADARQNLVFRSTVGGATWKPPIAQGPTFRLGEDDRLGLAHGAYPEQHVQRQ